MMAFSLVFLAWAAVEARRVPWRNLASPRVPSPAVPTRQVEESFADIRAALAADRTDEATLALRRRIEHGPHRGYAWYLLGEAAFRQGAYAAAVRHFRRAVESDPTVVDRRAPFQAGTVLDGHLTALLNGPWSTERPPEVRDLYFLRRRLGGGCE